MNLVEDVTEEIKKEPSKEVSLEDFQKLVECFRIITETNCTDCDIEKGVIRQRTNDRHSLLRMDLTPILGDFNLGIASTKQKVGIMRMFSDFEDSKNILITDKGTFFRYNDQHSKIESTKPDRALLDNQYISDEKYNDYTNIDSDELLLSTEIESNFNKKISIVGEHIDSDMVIISMNKLTATIGLEEANKENKITVVKDIPLNQEVEKSSCRVFILPFKMETIGPISLNIYKRKKNVAFCQFDMTLINGITFNVYILAKITYTTK
jgi:hypothetical protein